MSEKDQGSGATGWLKAHHLNWLGWVIVVLGLIFAGAMFYWVSSHS